MGHKYLEELELYTGPNWGLKEDEREEKWLEEERTYGFNSTETWDLDSAFYLWLYERLRMYMDVASKIVNLHYHKFTFKGHEFYQDELIQMMIERIQFMFSEEYNEFDENDLAYIREVGEIWAVVLPAMWW